MPDMQPYGDNLPPTLNLAMAWRCSVHPDSQEVWLRRFERPAPRCSELVVGYQIRSCDMVMQRVDLNQLRDTL